MAGTMHLTVQERMLARIAELDSGRWDGSVEAPTGAFLALSLCQTERTLIAAATEQEDDDVLAYWIVREDSQGFYDFAGFDSSENANLHLHALEKSFYEWCADDDEYYDL